MLLTRRAAPNPHSQIRPSRATSTPTPTPANPPATVNRGNPTPPDGAQDPELAASMAGLNARGRAARVAGMNGYNASPDLPPPLFVRALYDYEADDHTSLSFRHGDVIQVLTQLESGWWDGVMNNVRGWFPSNYCAVINGDEDAEDSGAEPRPGDGASTESGTEEDDEDDVSDNDVTEDEDAHTDDGKTKPQEEAAFWVPQATPDGRLFYFNTLTGVSTMELPLETPAADETGPRERTNIHIPGQTRPPREMADGQPDDEDDGSASEADVEVSRNGTDKSAHAASASQDSIRVRPNQSNHIPPDISISQIAPMMPPNGPSATSFSVQTYPQFNLMKLTSPKFFTDDQSLAPVTWVALVENMRMAVESYRQAIHARDRVEYVRRAEDISDHLRMLLAAGSGTTDNHSGNPSIISSNKALYPHFREMMSKFSKLVLSSHIAAADWPGPDSLAKCLQEAEGLLHGVYGYVDVARQQRGEDIPRLLPGFVLGSDVGGNWQDNNLEALGPSAGSFLDQADEPRTRSTIPLDANLMKRVEDLKRALTTILHRLEDQLSLQDNLMAPGQQAAIGDSVCLAAGAVIEHFRPLIKLIESIDLSRLGNAFRNPSLVDFGSQKQKIYDAIAELVITCQALTAPLPDEWSEVRGETMGTRLNDVRDSCKQLDNHITQMVYSLQLFLPATSLNNPPDVPNKGRHRMTDSGEAYQINHLRAEPAHPANQRPKLADVGHSNSYTIGQQDRSPEKGRRPPPKDKAGEFFGQVPRTLSNFKNTNSDPNFTADAVPWYLSLDHLNEVTYDTKTDIPMVKGGTLVGLVEQLTRHDRPDTNFNTTFLLTYRSFTTASELFELLVKRFNIQPPPGLNRDDFLIWEEHKQKPVRFRVVNILKSWFEHYWMESNDADSQNLLSRALAFAQGTINGARMTGATPLITVIEQRLKGQDNVSKRLVLNLSNSAPPPVLPKNMKKLKFLDIDTTEFARQLTIIESRLYSKIKPVECLDKTWQKKDRVDNADPAPNVKNLILHSNQLTNWVAEMILSHTEVRKRVAVIKHFVAVADRCRSLNNFSTLTAIVSALGTAPILRLNRTWPNVNPKTLAMLESMRSLIASTKNFGKYREALHVANPPCIPFLGVYLTDLTFIEDGIASVVKNTELINFAKRQKTGDVIRDIQQYQNVPYSLNPVAELQDWILANMKNARDVHEMYDQSLAIEPREREDEKIARVLSESGFL